MTLCLKNARSPEDVVRIVDIAKKNIAEALHEKIKRNIDKIVTEAETMGTVEGLEAVSKISNDISRDWLKVMEGHFDRLADVAEDAQTKTGVMNRVVWENGLAREDTLMAAADDILATKMVGLYKSLGGDTMSEAPATFLGKMLGVRDNRCVFYMKRRQIMDDYWVAAERATEGLADEKQIALIRRNESYKARTKISQRYNDYLLADMEYAQDMAYLMATQWSKQFESMGPEMMQSAFNSMVDYQMKAISFRKEMAASNLIYRQGVVPLTIRKAWGNNILSKAQVDEILKITGSKIDYTLDKSTRYKNSRRYYDTIYRRKIGEYAAHSANSYPRPPTGLAPFQQPPAVKPITPEIKAPAPERGPQPNLPGAGPVTTEEMLQQLKDSGTL